LLEELHPPERDVARRVIQSIFTDDDEGQHHVEREESFSVCKLPVSSEFIPLTPKYRP
jgi:hypothetical protein